MEKSNSTGGEEIGEAKLIRAMLQKGRTVSQIVEFAGLTVEEVMKVKITGK